jgi:Ca2+-transporting ATPase
VPYNFTGLSESKISGLVKQYGRNKLEMNDSKRLLRIVWDIVKEPMFLLLSVACVLYFILGENTEGLMMIVALIFVAAISVFQEIKSSNALQALQQLTEPKVKVIRDAVQKEISIELLVPGDMIVIEEGEKIPADAEVVQQNDFTVNESILTGESFAVAKTTNKDSNIIYQGTVVNSGKCIAKVTATGNHTALGKIGKSITTYAQSKTLLQKQINSFVKLFAVFGFAAFILIFFVNYLHYQNIATSLLFGLTLAMSAIPEEIPVAFSSFMALGAYHMSRLGIITRQPQTIENLGAVNIICLDKTGTITENKMEVHEVYDFELGKAFRANDHSAKDVLFYALLASEEKPFDAMEKAIVEAYATHESEPHLSMIFEYPLEGKPPMMTHVYQKDNVHIAAAKGAVERIISVCHLSAHDAKKVLHEASIQAKKGHRVLGVASAIHTNEKFPLSQDDFEWTFKGLLSFYDPPKPFVNDVFQQFTKAGVNIKLLTGDFAETALAIAAQSGLTQKNTYVTGEEIMQATDDELAKLCVENYLFVRMYPEAKTKVINALIQQGNIVAMIGDGVNDGPALKAANIGIAMGEKGTEVARQAADLVVTDDDLRKVVEAIRQGRKIFSNLKKAIRYIISIHIPIVLTASLPLLFSWTKPNIFTPIHIIFLELIMGPTCSVFFEREPVEEYIMNEAPRDKNANLFTRNEFLTSVVQGSIITAGVLTLYYIFMSQNAKLEEVRTIVFTTLLLSNIFLTFANRSFSETFFKTIRYKNNLVLPVLIISILFLAIIHFIPAVRSLFGMTILSQMQFIICMVVSFMSVIWFELYKSGLKGIIRNEFTDQKHAFH